MTQPTPATEAGFRDLFDGKTLDGWFAVPRIYGKRYPGGPEVHDIWREIGRELPVEPEKHPARWFVEDGYIVGEQDEPGSGYGGYLVSEEQFGDFELVLEVRPDWPADTGIMLRRQRDDWTGFQVLLDHRECGGIGGFFGNGLDSFMAIPFKVCSKRDADGNPIGLIPDDPATSTEPLKQEHIDRLDYAGDIDEFLRVWKWADWNEMQIRCVGGALPVITTWVNGMKVAELDTARIDTPNYDPEAVAALLGPRGHIAFEVHDNDAYFGEARWARGAQCRWRNIRIREL